MKLYSYYRSSSAWRVRIVLSWKGLEYEYVAVSLAPGARAQALPGFEAVNALRQVPVLEWTHGAEQLRLSQSVAIAELLEEWHPRPPLFPEGALARARVREAMEIVSSGIQPLQNSGVLERLTAFTDASGVARWTREVIATGLGALEAFARAHAGRHLVGDAVSLADVFLVPQLYNARRFEVDLSPYPRLVEIEGHAANLPAFCAARPDVQPDAPRGDPS